jgi:hypothetical protein
VENHLKILNEKNRLSNAYIILLRLVLLAEKVDCLSTLEEIQGLYTFVFALNFYLHFSLELPYLNHLRTNALSFQLPLASISRFLRVFIVKIDYTRTIGILHGISPAASVFWTSGILSI